VLLNFFPHAGFGNKKCVLQNPNVNKNVLSLYSLYSLYLDNTIAS
jgi:hypothetical protein